MARRYEQLTLTTDARLREFQPMAARYGKSRQLWIARHQRSLGSSPSFIEGRISVANPTIEASDRKTFGHREADLMMFSTYAQAILTVHERKSRLLLAIRLTSKAADGDACATSSPPTTTLQGNALTSGTSRRDLCQGVAFRT